MQIWSSTCLGSEPANIKGKTYDSPPQFTSPESRFSLSLFLRSKMLLLQVKNSNDKMVSLPQLDFAVIKKKKKEKLHSQNSELRLQKGPQLDILNENLVAAARREETMWIRLLKNILKVVKTPIPLVYLREPCLVGEQGLNSAAPTVFSLKGTMSYHITHTME